jgi:hypothetical protein
VSGKRNDTATPGQGHEAVRPPRVGCAIVSDKRNDMATPGRGHGRAGARTRSRTARPNGTRARGRAMVPRTWNDPAVRRWPMGMPEPAAPNLPPALAPAASELEREA